MSLIVASDHVGAIGLYEYLGFTATGASPIVPYSERMHGGNWVLMSKRL